MQFSHVLITGIFDAFFLSFQGAAGCAWLYPAAGADHRGGPGRRAPETAHQPVDGPQGRHTCP